jgi:serine/threonine-protein kinase
VGRDSEVTIFLSRGPQKVPDVVGLSQADAEKSLRDNGFVPVVVNSSTSDAPEGQVIQQIPGAGTPSPQGTQVTIVVSTGPSSPATTPTTPPTSAPTTLPTTPPPS